MPTIATSQLLPPESWDEFENICADLFSLGWGDPSVVRHGRQGQRQHGVDIYGRPAKGRYEGVQCKGKSVWPPTALTAAEITKEVNKAKTFSPPLSKFIIATIANDDAALQAHARALTERYEKRNLFSVHVFGWQELSRRIKSHEALIQKYFGYTGFSSIRKDIQDLPQRTAELVLDAFVINGFPLDLVHSQPILSDAERSSVLEAVITDLHRFLPIAAALQLPEAQRIADNTITWAELLHPTLRVTALPRLRQDMQVPSAAVQKLPFSLAYDPDFDPGPIERFLQRRESMGGLDGDELRAALIVHIRKNDPRAVTDFIQEHRAPLEALMTKPAILSMEIQALAMAKDAASARVAFEENKDIFEAEVKVRLAAEVAKAEGKDPVTEHLRVYETVKTTDALRELVRALAQSNDHRGIAKYAEELYGQTASPHDIILAARAAARAGDQDNFIRIVESYPIAVERDSGVALHYAWQLLRLGRLTESKQLSAQLQTRTPPTRDLNLEIALAIQTGNWDHLPELLSACLAEPSADGPALMRAASLAQAAGQGPMTDLMEAALARPGARRTACTSYSDCSRMSDWWPPAAGTSASAAR